MRVGWPFGVRLQPQKYQKITNATTPSKSTYFRFTRMRITQPATKLAMSWGKRTIRRTAAAATQNSATLSGLRFLHCFPRRYSCTKPSTNKTTEATSSQGRAICNLTLAPASPIAPRKPNGRQHARVENAAITAATGVARSAILMPVSLPLLRSRNRQSKLLLRRNSVQVGIQAALQAGGDGLVRLDILAVHADRGGARKHQLPCLGIGSYSYRPDFRPQGLGGQHPLDLLDSGQVVRASGRVKDFYFHSSSPPEVSRMGHAAGACCRRCFSSALHFRKSAASSDSSRSSSRIFVRTSANFAIRSFLTDSHASTLRARRFPNPLISVREKPSACIRWMKRMRSMSSAVYIRNRPVVRIAFGSSLRFS